MNKSRIVNSVEQIESPTVSSIEWGDWVEQKDLKSEFNFDITKLLEAYAQLPPEVHEQNEKSCPYTVLPDLLHCWDGFSRKILLINLKND